MISIVVPTLNEAKNIALLARNIAAAMGKEPFELIVVDDDSPDQTWKIAGELPVTYCVKVVRRFEKKGLSCAVVEGLAHSTGNIVGMMDADLSHPPETISVMIDEIRRGGADLVVASRLIPGGGTEGWPRSRKLTSRVATILARPLTAVKDPMSGFLFFRKEILDGVCLKPRGYKIGLEIMIKSRARKIVEVPIIFKDRTAGESKLSMKQNVEYLVQLIGLYFFTLKRMVWRQKSY